MDTYLLPSSSTSKFDYGIVIVGTAYSGRSTLLRLIRKVDVLDLICSKRVLDNSSSSSAPTPPTITSLISSLASNNETTNYGYQFQLRVLNCCVRTIKLILNELMLNEQQESVHGFSSITAGSSLGILSEYADVKNNYEKQIEEIVLVDSLLDTHRINRLIDSLNAIWMLPCVKSTFNRLLDCGYFTPFFQFSHEQYGHAFSNPHARGENMADLLDNLSFIMRRPIRIQGSEKDMKNGTIKIVEYLLKTYLDNTFFDKQVTVDPNLADKRNYISESRERVMGVKFGEHLWGVKTDSKMYSLAHSYNIKPAPVILFLVPLSDLDKKKSKRTLFVNEYLEKFYTTLTDPGTQKVLVFTKADIFSKRILSGSMDVQKVFPDYVGNSRDPLRVFEHFFNKFWVLCRKYHEVVPYYVVNLVDMEENLLFLKALLESGSPYRGRSFLSKQILKATDNLTKSKLRYHILSNAGHFSDVRLLLTEQ